jgi:catechol 2,3-dioxygenase-like lactoylglutathione lyase family enzyme
MIHGIDHTAISVPDLRKALDFYCGVLGFEVVFEAGWPVGAPPLDTLVGLRDSSSKVAMIRFGPTRIELFEYATPAPARQDPKRPVNDHGYTHICLRVSDIAAEHARLSRAGMRFNSAPVDLGPDVCVYGRDPFGNTIELIETKPA